MRFILYGVALVALGGSSILAAAADPRLVPVIKDVAVDVQGGKPPALVVKATGEVTNTGFSSAKLARVKYVTPPADGVQEYTLTAVPPDGPAGQAITDVTASDSWANYEAEAPWLKGVRVKGAGDGVKTSWLKADVVLGKDAAAGKAKLGQVVEVRTTYGVFPPFPTDFALTVNGKPVLFNGQGGADRVNGHLVVGAARHSFFFQPTQAGKLTVVASFKRGKDAVEKTVELEVTE